MVRFVTIVETPEEEQELINAILNSYIKSHSINKPIKIEPSNLICNLRTF